MGILGAKMMAMPVVQGLARKTKLPCVHDLCSRVVNGYRSKLKYIQVPETKLNLEVCQVLYQQGFLSSVVRGNHLGIDYSPSTPENIATRRYWLTLKYRENQAVLSDIKAISIPSRKVFGTGMDFENLISGRRAGMLAPLQPGEIIVVKTDKGVLEIHDAVALKLGGQVLCRAS